MECCEKLIVPNSNEIAVKRNVWNLLSLDIQLDVFQCLRAYDLYRNGRFASRQWYNVIEHHRGMLPKFRQLMDCREQNRLIESNIGECHQRQDEIWDAEERANRIRRNLMWTYLLLSILNFIAILLAQPISAEQIVAKVLLLTVTLGMRETYKKIVYDVDKSFICGRWYSMGMYSIYLKPLKYVWPVYLGVRFLIFVGLGILVRLFD
ncbi:hypothetical protein Ddc_17221 [Ditylenchus destructor]|nr:hypothetical protein Ddc_17221 [Ditylenchus destructor]